MTRPFVVGLTGGIGSGKSAAAEVFSTLGATVIDTDAIAHALTAPGGDAIPALIAAFGDQVIAPDGALDRAAMRRRIFMDPAERQRLEAFLHPLIHSVVDARIHRLAGADFSSYVVLVVPLLLESGSYHDRVDRIAVVDCPEDLQVKRVMARSGLSAAEVRAIIGAQASRQARLAAADDVIHNDGNRDQLARQVLVLHDGYVDHVRMHCSANENAEKR